MTLTQVAALTFSLSLVVGSAASQKTWIVDASGGGNFKKLQAAFNAASDGDTILMRSGYYLEIATTSKALVVRGSGVKPLIRSLTVQSLGAKKSFVLKAIDVFSLTLKNNKGSVHCENVVMRAQPRTLACFISSCAHVTMSQCTASSNFTPRLSNQAAIVVNNSTLVLNEVSAQGSRAYIAVGYTTYGASPALETYQSHIRINAGSLAGGSGQVRYSSLYARRAPGVRATGGTLIISWSGGTSIASGSGGNSAIKVPAIQMTSASLELDPRVTLTTVHSSPKVGGVIPKFRQMLGIQASGAMPGGFVVTTAFATPKSVSVLFAGVPSVGHPTPFGELWLSAASLVLMDVGLVPQSGQRVVKFAVPLSGIPYGLVLGFHAANISGKTIELSPPATAIVN